MEHNGSTTGYFNVMTVSDYYRVAQPNDGVVSKFFTKIVNAVKFFRKHK